MGLAPLKFRCPPKASTRMRMVVKVRGVKVSFCPAPVREALPRSMVTGDLPSKVRVTRVIHRLGSPVWGWTSVTVPSVVGLSSVTCHHCPVEGAKASSSQAVWVFPSRAAEGRSSAK
jgi:hypothetical protein